VEWLLILACAFIIIKIGHKFTHVPNQKNKKSNNSGVVLSDEQMEIYRSLEKTSIHSFITGKAGTGKSVLLKYFADNTDKKVVKIAPTGIAAMNVKGQTIHSLFKFSLGLLNPKEISISEETRQILSKVDALIIDEISMVRADTIDAIDHVLRKAKKNSQAFGGVQFIAFGDVYQLPPVVESTQIRHYFADTYGGPYFFNAHVWKNTDLHKYELQTVFRQSDIRFKAILNAIRRGEPTEDDFKVLNSRVIGRSVQPKGDIITLTSTNNSARKINMERNAKLTSKSKTYHSTITGRITANSFPTDSELTLKIGAQVMFLKNDSAGRWVNGTIGKIYALSKQSVKVACGTKIYDVYPATWEKNSYHYDEDSDVIKQEVQSTFTQIPLKLAWAITIHKAQGCTYSNVAIDLKSGAFAHGQAYVALSRCRSLYGLYLHSELGKKDIIVEPAIVDFMRSIQV
jgi:ATP-dependent DNA helicase PIF1